MNDIQNTTKTEGAITLAENKTHEELILDFLKDRYAIESPQAAELCKVTIATARKIIRKMIDEGQISELQRGLYTARQLPSYDWMIRQSLLIIHDLSEEKSLISDIVAMTRHLNEKLSPDLATLILGVIYRYQSSFYHVISDESGATLETLVIGGDIDDITDSQLASLEQEALAKIIAKLKEAEVPVLDRDVELV